MRVLARCARRALQYGSVLAGLLLALLAPQPAAASELIDRNATHVRLAVNDKGVALLTYRARGKVHRVFAWGAINALAPTLSRPQVRFQLDYSGGWRLYRNKDAWFRKNAWRLFQNHCSPYDGPKLAWFVLGCKAADGSYWAVQSWQRMLPNYGLAPTAAQAVWELRLSHWRGELPKLEIELNWAYRRYDHLFGRFSYRDAPVHGFRSTSTGVPLDRWGRNIYVDTFNSAYGPGWKRENSFLTHLGSGLFCYGLYPHGDRPSGTGERYRATVIGPGVTPDAFWQEESPGPYDSERDLEANERQRQLFGESQLCRPN